MVPDLVRLLGAAASLAGLGLVMGFSPVLYAVTLRLLAAGGRAAGGRIRWMALGLALATLLEVALFRLFDPETLIAVLRGRVEAVLVARGVDLTAGALLAVLGIREMVRWRRGTSGGEAVRSPRASTEAMGPSRAVGMGMLGAVGISDVATAYVAGRAIASSSARPPLELIPLAVFLAATVAPYLVLASAGERFPALTRGITRTGDRLSRADRRPLVALGLLGAGAGFLALGVWGHGHPLR